MTGVLGKRNNPQIEMMAKDIPNAKTNKHQNTHPPSEFRV
jgi:hypothetical protein